MFSRNASNVGGGARVANTPDGAFLEAPSRLNTNLLHLLDNMLLLPHQQLNVTRPIFLWMATCASSESYKNPFTISVLEYLANHMSYNSSLKQFMADDITALERKENRVCQHCF